MSAISLLSSGLDSVAALSLAKEQAEIELAITFDYGQRSAQREIEYAKIICKHFDIEHEIIVLDWLGKITKTSLVSRDMDVPILTLGDISDSAAPEITQGSAKNVWVPNRNGVMINIAASFAESFGCEYVIVGFNGEEAVTFPDNSFGYVQAVDRCLSYSTRNCVKVLAPLIEFDKNDIVREALRSGAPLEWSWSCYHGAEAPCGVCESCVRRARGFAEAGTKDPLLVRLMNRDCRKSGKIGTV
ncbi:MAG TPA: 7-cyano-7-deazaguanine synthase QueC [Methanosarcinaceae archaeon]|nr:7-cyano-7-deazaguanine synthase QueC [Methanosarcinaceae archaeon]